MRNPMWGSEYCAALLCVDAYEEGVCRGRFYHPLRPEGEVFHSLVQFFLKLEELFDEMDRPQADTKARTFGPRVSSKGEKPELPGEKVGALSTFWVRVLFRQHASWQGELLWTEKGKRQAFRSVLELIHLLDSALLDLGRKDRKTG